MKAISIKQPWASLIVHGIKDIENRTWMCPQKYIGKRVLIHASKERDKREKPLLTDKQYELAGDVSGYGTHIFGDRGAIIGSVKIVSCVQNHPSVWAEKNTLKIGDVVPYKNTRGNIKNAEITSFEVIERNGKIWFHGIDTISKAKVWYPTHISLELMGGKPIYNWILSEPILYENPIENVKGKLSFWDYDGIEEVTIECPECGFIQPAVVNCNTAPFNTYIHDCKRCGYLIQESEWNEVKEEDE